MKKSIFVAILIPCILACIFIFLLILNGRDSSTEKPGEVVSGGEISVTPAQAITPRPTPATTPTEAPTQSTAPTASPTGTPAPAATFAPTAAPTPTVPSATPTQKPDAEITPKPQNPEPKDPAGDKKYDALYKQEGDNFTLVADKATKAFLFINHQDQSIRKTAYTYHPKYEQDPGNFFGPVLGYKNKTFIFIAQDKIIASDGVTDTILINLADKKVSGDIHINPLIQSDNRIMAGVEGTLVVIDCRTLAVETYTESYSVDFFIFTDEYLCFSSKRRIPAGSYYNYLYTAKDGKVQRLGSIEDFEGFGEPVLNADVITIKSGEESYSIDLKTNTMTSSVQLEIERTLYFPVYGTGLIQGLSEMKFVNYNQAGTPVQSIQLPSYLEAECYYGTYYAISQYSLQMKDAAKAELLPRSAFGGFAAIDTTTFPLEEGKFLMHSTVKEKLYSGVTSIGEGEIFLLERNETLNETTVPLEMIYAWIPIQGELRAYQLYLYVPLGEDKTAFLNLAKQFLQIQ